MKNFIYKTRSYFLIFTLLFLPLVTGANERTGGQTPPGGSGGVTPPGGSGGVTPPAGLTNPLKVTSIEGLIAAILEIVVKIGAPLIVLFIIYSGFLFVKAQGNEEKLKEAKKALAWTVVGAAILLGAWLIAEVIQNTITNLRG